MDLLKSIPGQLFLIFYIIISISIIVFSKIKINKLTKKDTNIEDDLTEYEIAYLKGKNKNVVRVALFKLSKLGLIDKEGSKNKTTIVRTNKSASVNLNPLEVFILDQLEKPATINEIFNSLSYKINKYTDLIEEKLISLNLLYSKEELGKLTKIRLLSVFIIMIIGLPKLYLGLTNDRPSGFLFLAIILFTIISLSILKVQSYHTVAASNHIKKLSDGYVVDIADENGNTGEHDSDSTFNNDAVAFAVLGIYAFSGMDSYNETTELINDVDSTGDSGISSFGSSDSGFDGGSDGGSSGCSGGSDGGGCGGCGGGCS